MFIVALYLPGKGHTVLGGCKEKGGLDPLLKDHTQQDLGIPPTELVADLES